jgi:hypothetical protein
LFLSACPCLLYGDVIDVSRFRCLNSGVF